MIYIFFLLFAFQNIFCEIHTVAITNNTKSGLTSRNYLYCSKSPTNSINIFYRLDFDYYREIYDSNENFVKRYENQNKDLKKFEFFDNELEYLMIKEQLYYIKDDSDKIEKSYYRVDDFFILKNKDFIAITYRASLAKLRYYLSIDWYSYENLDEIKTSIDLNNVFVKHYQIKETSDAILFFILLDEEALSNKIDLYLWNKKTLQFNKLKTISEEVTGFTIISLNDNLDEFIYCISLYFDDSKCFIANYKNRNVNLGNSINIFSWQCLLPKTFLENMKVYALLKNNQIAIICPTNTIIDLAILEKKGDNLSLKEEERIIEYNAHYSINNPFLIYNQFKGLILYHINNTILSNEYSILKTYMDDTCTSFEMEIHKLKRYRIIFVDNILSSRKTFMITEYDREKLTLLRNDEVVIAGNTVYNSSDIFELIAEDSDDPLIIKFKIENKDYTCDAIINIFHYKIKVKAEEYKCDLSPERIEVNNITNTDLDKRIILNSQSIFFTAEFNSKVEKNDFIYRYLNTRFTCQGRFDNYIYCDVPVYYDLVPGDSNKYQYDIYSYLSCTNEIPVGTIYIEDPYLIEIIEANNLPDISINIDKKYDASQKIEKFSVDMINYYYWLSCFSNCPDSQITSGQCCKEELLSEWEVLSNSEISFSYLYVIKEMQELFKKEKIISPNILSFISPLFLQNLMIEEIKDKVLPSEYADLLLEKILKTNYNYAILKSVKYKKYVFSFPGLSNFIQLFTQIFSFKKEQFDDDPNIQVNEYFNLIFSQLRDKIFTTSIIREINLHKDYQIIFTGYSLGGAIATLSSYYFKKNKLASNDLVLITFGQPRVGNENFARDYMKYINNVYRIERKEDIMSMWPPSKRFIDSELWGQIYNLLDSVSTTITSIGKLKFIIDLFKIVLSISNPVLLTIELLNAISDYMKDYVIGTLKHWLDQILQTIVARYISEKLPYDYCHIGGLYVMNKKSDKFYHCKDFYNEDTNSPFCKNFEITLNIDSPNAFLTNHHYLTTDQVPRKRCSGKTRFGLVNQII
jgi:hypothetical protein